MNGEANINQHSISLDNRRKMSISGVTDVDSYDENTIVAITNMGEMTVQGSELHIARLDVNAGDMLIEGSISSLSYNDRKQEAQGLLKRLFR